MFDTQPSILRTCSLPNLHAASRSNQPLAPTRSSGASPSNQQADRPSLNEGDKKLEEEEEEEEVESGSEDDSDDDLQQLVETMQSMVASSSSEDDSG